MLFLPTGIRMWFERQAVDHDTNLGAWLIRVVCDKAYTEGFTCSHPTAYQVLYKKADGKSKPIWRCKFCGEQYVKVS